MLLLKDLKPLLDLEFCYSWSDLKKGNNGILRLKKRVNYVVKLSKNIKFALVHLTYIIKRSF